MVCYLVNNDPKYQRYGNVRATKFFNTDQTSRLCPTRTLDVVPMQKLVFSFRDRDSFWTAWRIF